MGLGCGEIGGPDGDAAIEIEFSDLAGNPGSAVTSTTDGSSVTIDLTAPTLTAVAIRSDNAAIPVYTMAKAGDEVTLSFAADEDITGVTAKIAGSPAAVQANVQVEQVARIF